MLSGPSFIPNDVKNALILFHGYGADGDDLFSLTPFFKNHFKNMAFFMPNAPEATFGAGYQWFSLDDYFEKQNLDEKYLAVLSERALKNIPLIQDYISFVQKKTGLSKKNIFIGGFSQGGLMAAQSVFQEKESFAGLLLMSPVPPAHIPSSAQKLDILITRGDQDTVIPPLAATQTYPLFKRYGFNAQEVIDPFAPHAISELHLNAILSFIQSHLS